MERNLTISTRTIFIILIALASFWLVFQLRNVLALLFVSLVLTLGLDPFVDRIQGKRLPRGIAVLITYIVFLGVIAGIIVFAVSPVVNQTKTFFQGLPKLLDAVFGLPGYENTGEEILKGFTSRIAGSSGSVFRFTLGVFSNLFSVLTILVFTYYFLLEFDKLKEKLISLFSREVRDRVRRVVEKIEVGVGAWLRGQFFLMLIVGVVSFVGLTLLRVDYALSLALIAGLLEIVPIIGPIISAIPAVVVAAASSPLLALGVAALFFLIQQLENQLLVPKVMQKAVGFSPLITLVVLLLGGRLFGVVGALLAVPTTLIIYLILREVLEWETSL